LLLLPVYRFGGRIDGDIIDDGGQRVLPTRWMARDCPFQAMAFRSRGVEAGVFAMWRRNRPGQEIWRVSLI